MRAPHNLAKFAKWIKEQTGDVAGVSSSDYIALAHMSRRGLLPPSALRKLIVLLRDVGWRGEYAVTMAKSGARTGDLVIPVADLAAAAAADPNALVEITLTDVQRGRVRLGVTAPREVRIWRREIFDAIQAGLPHKAAG